MAVASPERPSAADPYSMDALIFDLGKMFARGEALWRKAQALGDDIAFESAYNCTGEIVDAMARLKAESLEALLVQAGALSYYYEDFGPDHPENGIEIDQNTGERRLICALVRGLYALTYRPPPPVIPARTAGPAKIRRRKAAGRRP